MRLNSSLLFVLFSVFSCQKKDYNGAFKIYHLKPNSVSVNSDTLLRSGQFQKSRSDFYVLKNFDVKNKVQQLKVNRFVLNQIKKDSFLIHNKNAEWHFTFFKYGNGITENTTHQYGTDYAIHQLFSYKKELVNFHFNNRVGFVGVNYRVSDVKVVPKKAKMITHYFDSLAILNPKLNQSIKTTLQDLNYDYNVPTIKKDTIKLKAIFIKSVNKNASKIAQFKLEKNYRKFNLSKNDTIKVTYSNTFQLNKITPKKHINLLRYQLKFNSNVYYTFLNDKDVNLTISAE